MKNLSLMVSRGLIVERALIFISDQSEKKKKILLASTNEITVIVEMGYF